MNEARLQEYLHAHIPLAAAMGVEVREAGVQRVVLRAPLGPNINHRETVFGGSASAVATLSAWCLLHIRLTAQGRESRLVIQAHTMCYDRPIGGAFEGVCALSDESAWERFMRAVDRRGKGRIRLGAQLEYEGLIAGRFEGAFVALGG